MGTDGLSRRSLSMNTYRHTGLFLDSYYFLRCVRKRPIRIIFSTDWRLYG
jgi:hypothetical protein